MGEHEEEAESQPWRKRDEDKRGKKGEHKKGGGKGGADASNP